jgi:hypothetical protein
MAEKYSRRLDNGLIIRHGAPADGEALAKFNREMHGEDEWDGKGVADWTLDLISGQAPTFAPDDFTIVEDPQTGAIVSSCCTISQVWTYAGIPFKVGRPELVGTHPDYRRRGLVRQQFEILHGWRAERGELVQAITGIPYYYRQFGYEMTLNLGGGRSGWEENIPPLKEGQAEPFTFSLAEPADIPFLMALYDRGCERSLISAQWDEALWAYELTGKRKYNINRRDIYLIQDQAGKKVGFIGMPPIKWGNKSALTLYEITPEASWADVTPSVLRFLWGHGEALAQEQGQKQTTVGFWLGEEHPAYSVAAANLPRVHQPYAYYLRVPDLAGFLTQVKPALEQRLAQSAFVNLTQVIKLSFYREGISLSFKDGQLVEVVDMRAGELEDPTACFPPLMFLHLLFGHRTMAELHHIRVDCYAKDEPSRHLLDALFPKKFSEVWPIS